MKKYYNIKINNTPKGKCKRIKDSISNNELVEYAKEMERVKNNEELFSILFEIENKDTNLYDKLRECADNQFFDWEHKRQALANIITLAIRKENDSNKVKDEEMVWDPIEGKEVPKSSLSQKKQDVFERVEVSANGNPIESLSKVYNIRPNENNKIAKEYLLTKDGKTYTMYDYGYTDNGNVFAELKLLDKKGVKDVYPNSYPYHNYRIEENVEGKFEVYDYEGFLKTTQPTKEDAEHYIDEFLSITFNRDRKARDKKKVKDGDYLVYGEYTTKDGVYNQVNQSFKTYQKALDFYTSIMNGDNRYYAIDMEKDGKNLANDYFGKVMDKKVVKDEDKYFIEITDPILDNTKWYPLYDDVFGNMDAFTSIRNKAFIFNSKEDADNAVYQIKKKAPFPAKFDINVLPSRALFDSKKARDGRNPTTTRRQFTQNDIDEEGSWLGTTEWGTPKGSLFVYKKGDKIIAEAQGVAYGDPKGTFEFNSLYALNKWLLDSRKVKDSVATIFKSESTKDEIEFRCKQYSLIYKDLGGKWEVEGNKDVLKKFLSELNHFVCNPNEIEQSIEDKKSIKDYKVEVLMENEDGYLDVVGTYGVNYRGKYDSEKILQEFFEKYPQYKGAIYSVQITDSAINYKGFTIEKSDMCSNCYNVYNKNGMNMCGFLPNNTDIKAIKQAIDDGYLDAHINDSRKVKDNDYPEWLPRLIQEAKTTDKEKVIDYILTRTMGYGRNQVSWWIDAYKGQNLNDKKLKDGHGILSIGQWEQVCRYADQYNLDKDKIYSKVVEGYDKKLYGGNLDYIIEEVLDDVVANPNLYDNKKIKDEYSIGDFTLIENYYTEGVELTTDLLTNIRTNKSIGLVYTVDINDVDWDIEWENDGGIGYYECHGYRGYDAGGMCVSNVGLNDDVPYDTAYTYDDNPITEQQAIEILDIDQATFNALLRQFDPQKRLNKKVVEYGEDNQEMFEYERD